MRKILSGAVAAALGTAMVAVAAPASAGVTATVAMPQCCVTDVIAAGSSVIALAIPPGGTGPEQAALTRIDPVANTVTGTLALPNGLPGGRPMAEVMVWAAGSVWITAYFENEVLRIDPETMKVTAAIATGRSPDSLAYDGHSVWVALQNQRSVARIDPVRNAVVQTVAVGSARDTSDGPYQIAVDGTDVITSMPVSGRVARINTSTGRVRYDEVGSDAAACAVLRPSPGGYWLDDTDCSNSYYRWDDAHRRISTEVAAAPLGDYGAAVVGSYLYTAEYSCTDTCTDGQLVKRDAVTGAPITTVATGEEAFMVHFAADSFWVGDWDAGALVRVANF